MSKSFAQIVRQGAETAIHFDEEEEEKNEALQQNDTSFHSITNYNIDAERFIPQNKREQWDKIPLNIIAMGHPYLINSNASDEFQALWVRNVQKRISPLEPCAYNILHQIPASVSYMQSCHRLREFPMYNPQILYSYNSQMLHIQQAIFRQQKIIKNIEKSLSPSSTSPMNPYLKTGNIVKLYKSLVRRHYVPNDYRTMQTTPETLAKLCDEINRIVCLSEQGVPVGVQSILELSECQKIICKDYLIKTNMLMDIERLQGMEDIKAYDLYSFQFDMVEIPPPKASRKSMKCRGCNPETASHKKNKHLCPYHKNLCLSDQYDQYGGSESFRAIESLQGAKKASIVRSKNQFQTLSHILEIMRVSNSCIIVYITIPGIAENRPLVNIGDLLRFRFGSMEVIGEVLSVNIRNESVMIALPLPSLNENYSDLYMNALQTPKNRPPDENINIPISRFDIRFGLFSSRAHDIFKETAMTASNNAIDQVTRILSPSPFLDGVQKKSDRRLQIGISEWAHDLNSEQKHAVFDIVRKNHGTAPYIIYGPPGTGKTMTVVESVIQILRHDPEAKILVCAPSDAACDVVAKRLLPILPIEHRVLRANWWARKYDSLPPELLSCSLIDENGSFVMPRKIQIEAASVIVCQCFVAGCLDIYDREEWMSRYFTHTFIDESSQSFEFESLIPLLKVGKECSIILSGDPKQLAPITRSNIAASNGLSLSLQERLMGLSLYSEDTNYAVITKLLDNYRSHDALLRIPSELFYAGSLRCKASSTITSVCKDFEWLYDGNKFPLMAYDVEGVEKSKIDTPSFYNVEECEAIVKIIKALQSDPNVDITTGQIAVITCFRAQVLKLREVLRKENLGTVNVGVVEDFQGQETSVVLISTVLTKDHTRWKTGSKSGLGFMTDPKRFNVAITRASALCIIVGKVEFLESSGSYWTSLIEHIRRNGGISGEDYGDESLDDYGIDLLLSRVQELQLLGSGHEFDRYDLAMRGYYDDAPEWRVCL